MGAKWYQLGIQLLDENQAPQLEIIKANHDDVIGCCTALFSYWLQTHPNASWCELVVALRAPGVEMNEVAASVERTFHGTYVKYVTQTVCRSMLLPHFNKRLLTGDVYNWLSNQLTVYCTPT